MPPIARVLALCVSPFNLAGAALTALCFAGSASAQPDQTLPPMGGSGGGGFTARCEQGEVLNGFELRAGDDVDAIRPICVIAYGSDLVGLRRPHVQFFGGPGGAFAQVVCPDKTPIVAGLKIGSEGVHTETVNSLHLFCGRAATSQKLSSYPTVLFDAPWKRQHDLGPLRGSDPVLQHWDTEQCPVGLAAVGVNGRFGKWLDAVGLVCGELRIAYLPGGVLGKSVGRVIGPPSTPGPRRPICDVAKEARARNSSAAPGLEAQCLASRPPAKALGRVATAFVTPAGPARPICDVAREARAQNNSAAPGLESRCRADLATRGEAIANQDPLSAELRTRARNGLSRRGFDIGMAAAKGDTAPGPGKQAIHDALTGMEQAGFDAAVAFSLQRNKNAPLAATGAAIASADTVVAQARTADPDVFYWLGFDIATGIFGDPALGALGNTAVGPGSLGIRNALGAAGQRGFNAAMALHLTRNYNRAPAVAAETPRLDAQSGPSEVVISQVYSGGGTVDATIASDFVELLNRGREPIDITGWSIQYASSSGTTWQVTPLMGTILPGHHFLIQESSSPTSGDQRPAPDVTHRIVLAANAGKIALSKTSVPLSGFCAAGPELADFMGYGSANCAEGGAPMPELGHATAALRNGAGCVDTNRNAADFHVAIPRPRSQAAEPVTCQTKP